MMTSRIRITCLSKLKALVSKQLLWGQLLCGWGETCQHIGSSSDSIEAALSAAGVMLDSWHHIYRLFCLALPFSHTAVSSRADLQYLDSNTFCQIHLACGVYIKLKEEESPFGNRAYCFLALFKMPESSAKSLEYRPCTTTKQLWDPWVAARSPSYLQEAIENTAEVLAFKNASEAFLYPSHGYRSTHHVWMFI